MPAPFPTARDPLLSVFQSAAAAVARLRGGDATQAATHPLVAAAGRIATAPDPMHGYAPPAGGAPSATTCAGLGLQLLKATVAGNAAQQKDMLDRLAFSQCDPLWAEILVDYAANLQPDGRPKPIPYVRYHALGDFVLPAPRPKARIGLLSDWGTGTQTARDVAALLARQQPDVVIHLGDIYYAGTADECRAHFLTPLRAAMPNTPLFTLCGNHDVYSGGSGYYGLLREIGQPASYFCLRSPDSTWQILAADTGLHDGDPLDVATSLTFLDPQEEAWHADKLSGFSGRTILLSHHQPFSAFAQIGPGASHDPTNPKLMASYARLSAAGRINAWFWGHEHRLCLYAPYRGVAVGRNIGFGAVPLEVVPGDPPLAGPADPPAAAVQVALDEVDGAYAHGFATLDVSAAGIEAAYWSVTRPDGPVYRERLDGTGAAPLVA